VSLLLVLPLLLLLLLLVAYLITAYVVSGLIVHLDRQPVPKTPLDYGLDFEAVTFRTEDGVDLKGWLIPGKAARLVIMTHVGGLTKYGSVAGFRSLGKLYDKEIEFLKTARHLHDAGYSVLTFDLRNHGESGPSPNRGMSSVGTDEYRDVVAALDFVRGREELRHLPIGFVSFCAGANSTIIAMSKRPEAFGNVRCLCLVQPISQEVFIRTYIGRLSIPLVARLLLPAIKGCIRLRGSHPLEAMSPREQAKDLRVPTLFVQAIHDPWTDLTDILGMFEATPVAKEFFWIEHTRHRFESYSYFQDKPEKMLDWLHRQLDGASLEPRRQRDNHVRVLAASDEQG
jgi:pimeloyl-ACP methyl ester carboxylesterase